MIPYHSEVGDFSVRELPDETFCLDFQRCCVTGMIDGLDAVVQSARLIMDTERYSFIIYSYYYGTELAGLLGKSADYASSELKRRISEALEQDDRITKVSDFEFSDIKGGVKVSFVISSTFGDIGLEKEIEL